MNVGFPVDDQPFIIRQLFRPYHYLVAALLEHYHSVHHNAVYERIKDLDLSREALERAYESSVFSDRRKIESAIEIVTILTKYILFEHLIEPESERLSENVARYIDANVMEDLNVGGICKRFHVSKSMLYRDFHSRFGCTVGEYVTARRIEKAELLLRTTQHQISEIGEMCGIDNYQYFCRLFKKTKGITPLQYRKNNSQI